MDNQNFLNLTSPERLFQLGAYEFQASVEFSMHQTEKLAAYKYTHVAHTDYEAFGVDERNFTLKFIIADWKNILTGARDEINQVRLRILNQIDNNPIRFVHPDIGPFDVFVSEFTISQVADKNAYEEIFFDCEIKMVEVTRFFTNNTNNTRYDETVEAFSQRQIASSDRHIAVEGDTLENIAEEFLGAPELAEVIWDYGDNILNNAPFTQRTHYTNPPHEFEIADIEFILSYSNLLNAAYTHDAQGTATITETLAIRIDSGDLQLVDITPPMISVPQAINIAETPALLLQAQNDATAGIASNLQLYAIDIDAGTATSNLTTFPLPDIIVPGMEFFIPRTIS